MKMATALALARWLCVAFCGLVGPALASCLCIRYSLSILCKLTEITTNLTTTLYFPYKLK